MINVNHYNSIVKEAQEVAFNYIGDYFVDTNEQYLIDPESKFELLGLRIVNNSHNNLQELNKPPSDASTKRVNNKSDFKVNRQNDNYGYPLSAD